MKLLNSGSNVIDSHGVQAEAAFKIKTSAQAFRILSSGLYSDKIAAVLREVGCNAADSHTVAGYPDLPIEVKLPNSLDREFYIKDYGIGLTHEEVTGLFSTYFSSNKSDNDEVTGAFGLGSKSPFSYTDSFSITAVKEGRQRSYAAHLGADGSPVISLLEDTPASADWTSGVMVTFPVNPADVPEFHAKAQTVFQRFRVLPKIVGAEAITPMQKGLEGENYWFPNPKDTRPASIIMGNVAYPLVAGALETEDPIASILIRSGIQLSVSIGAVMPTASREALEYDARTRQNVLNALKSAARALAQQLYAKVLEPCESGWARRQIMREYRDGLPEALANSLPTFVELLGLESSEEKRVKEFFSGNVYILPKWMGDDFDVNPATSCKVYLAGEVERKTGTTVMRKLIRYGHWMRGQQAQPAILPFDASVHVIYVDSTHGYARIRKYIEDGHAQFVLMVEAASTEAKDRVLPYAQRVATEVGGIPCKSSDTLPVPDLVRAVRGSAASRAAALKQAYVEETVQFLDLTASKVSAENAVSVAVAEVPKKAHYYLTGYVTKGRWGARGEMKFYADLPGGTRKTLGFSDLLRVLDRFGVLREAGLPLPRIEGFAILESGQSAKLRLAENGWLNLADAICQALMQEAVVAELRKRLNRMPLLDRGGWTSHAGARHLIALLRSAGYRNDAFWRAFKPHLKEFPALEKLLVPFMATNDSSNEREGLKGPLYELLGILPVPLKGQLPKDKTLEEIGNRFIEAYPYLQFLDADSFTRAAREDAVNAAQCLRLLLRSKQELLLAAQADPAKAA